MMRQASRKLLGNAIVARHLYGQRRIPYWATSRLAAARDRRIRGLVRYAARTVRHYRDLFARLGVDVREIRTADDLDTLPLLDKQTVRADPERFVSTSWRSRQALSLVTSGSTGEPLTIWHDRLSLLANVAFGRREWEVLHRATAPNEGLRISSLGYASSTMVKVLDFNRRSTWVPRLPQRQRLSVSSPIGEVIEAINQFRPHMITGYGSYLELLFRTAESRGLKIHRPRIITPAAEGMSEEGERWFETELELPVYSNYNAVECFKIGFRCEERAGFHLHDDLCHLRVVDEQGRDVAAGVSGAVVISNLVNHGTVLLNYRLGDRGVLTDEPCPCGRNLRRLARLEGRVEDIIMLADGRPVHPRAVWGILKKAGALRYELVQSRPTRFELQLLMRDRQHFDAAAPGIRRELESLLAPAELSIAHSESLREQSGPFHPVVPYRGPQ